VTEITKVWYTSPEGRRAIETLRTAADSQTAMTRYYAARAAWRAEYEGRATA